MNVRTEDVRRDRVTIGINKKITVTHLPSGKSVKGSTNKSAIILERNLLKRLDKMVKTIGSEEE